MTFLALHVKATAPGQYRAPAASRELLCSVLVVVLIQVQEYLLRLLSTLSIYQFKEEELQGLRICDLLNLLFRKRGHLWEFLLNITQEHILSPSSDAFLAAFLAALLATLRKVLLCNLFVDPRLP